ncbi:hypothetical protein HDU87_000052 [Geranomyces variabilis]|uniref:Uncharacterized protein n=1 Tax=Geranomyces variabilis TaxID=109894 RepID=A0AAD5TRZ5_9FUNG|nr:hypothetical protein HDU87_000052 [Geranomyces variabilis]
MAKDWRSFPTLLYDRDPSVARPRVLKNVRNNTAPAPAPAPTAGANKQRRAAPAAKTVRHNTTPCANNHCGVPPPAPADEDWHEVKRVSATHFQCKVITPDQLLANRKAQVDALVKELCDGAILTINDRLGQRIARQALSGAIHINLDFGKVRCESIGSNWRRVGPLVKAQVEKVLKAAGWKFDICEIDGTCRLRVTLHWCGEIV